MSSTNLVNDVLKNDFESLKKDFQSLSRKVSVKSATFKITYN